MIVTLSYFDNRIYSKFYETQNKTWNSVSVEGVNTFFLVGNSDTDEIENQIIKTNVEESLENCGYKTLKAFEQLKDFDYQYIYRTNSSSYIDKKLLKEYVQDKPKEKFYSGVIGNYNNILFSSGSGYIITKDLVDLVLENKNNWNHSFIDDVSLGLLLRTQNIFPIPAPRYDVHSLDKNIPINYYHYRIKSNNRDIDCEKMELIHKLKLDIM